MRTFLKENRFGLVGGAVALVFLLLSLPSVSLLLLDSDSGYQLALGRQLLLGKQPFTDFYFHFGPGAAYTTALMVWLGGVSPLPEMLLRAMGYAVALGLAMHLARQHAGWFAGLAVGLILAFTLARFYKWYYWLFPLITLAQLWPGPASFAMDQRLSKRDRRRLVWLGLVVGLAALFRLDLGLACGVLAAGGLVVRACMLETSVDTRPSTRNEKRVLVRRLVTQMLAMGLAAVAVQGAWALVLSMISGPDAVLEQYRFFLAASASMVESLGLPAFDFSVSTPWSVASRTAVGQVAALLVLLCVAVEVVVGRQPTAPANSVGASEQSVQSSRLSRYRLALLVLAGIAVMPQAFHRADAQHLLQVTPPLVIAAMGLLVGHKGLVYPAWLAWGFRVAGLLLLAILLTLPGRLRLSQPWDDPIGRIAKLANPMPLPDDTALARIATYINTHSQPDESVLVLPRPGQYHRTQMVYWIDRPHAGLFHMYYGSLYSEGEWPARNAAAIRDAPPTLVLASARLLREPEADPTLQHHPELRTLLVKHYTVVVYEDEGWVVLRAASDNTPAIFAP